MALNLGSLNISENALQGIDSSRLKNGKVTPEDIARLLEGMKGQTSFSAALTQEQVEEIAASLNAQAAQANADVASASNASKTDDALLAIKARDESATTYYNTQALGQDDVEAKNMLLSSTNTGTNSADASDVGDTDKVVAEFLKYMKMTPEERMLAQILGEQKLTMEDYKAMSPKDKEKIIAKLRERIEQQAQQEQNDQKQASKILASQSTQVFTDLRSNHSPQDKKGNGLFKEGKITLPGILNESATANEQARKAKEEREQSTANDRTQDNAQATPTPLGRRKRNAA